MIDRIRVYLEHAFANSPKTRRMEDLREELFSNLVEKYNDRPARGCLKRTHIMRSSGVLAISMS